MSSVPVSELESNLSDVLRRVKEGETVTVMDGETAVAQIVPPDDEPLIYRRATKNVMDIELLPRLETSVDIVDLLIEERGDR